jgi:universal stress protein E
MFRTILAAVADPRATVQVAAAKAAELAGRGAGRVVLYHATYDATLSGKPFFDSARLARVRQSHLATELAALEGVADALPSDVEVATAVEWARPAHEGVVGAAMREHADLVVAEPRYGRSRGRGRGFAHTDWELVRACPVPLLLARSTARYRRPEVVAAVDPLRSSARLSSLDLGIVRTAVAFSRLTGARLRLLHCVDEPRVAPPVSPEVLERHRARTRALLERLLDEAGLPRRALLTRSGAPAQTIERLVEEESVDVVVLGSMTRGAVGRLLLGSTAERLLHAAPCDLLVVKPSGFRTPVSPARGGRGLLRGPPRLDSAARGGHD